MVHEPNKSARRHFLKIATGSIIGGSIISPVSGKEEKRNDRIHIVENGGWKIIKIDKVDKEGDDEDASLNHIVQKAKNIDKIYVKDNKNKYIIKCKKEDVEDYKKKIKKQRKKHEEKIKDCEREIDKEMRENHSEINKGGE